MIKYGFQIWGDDSVRIQKLPNRHKCRRTFGGYGQVAIVNDGVTFGQSNSCSSLEENIDRCDNRGVVFKAKIWSGCGEYLPVSENDGRGIWKVLAKQQTLSVRYYIMLIKQRMWTMVVRGVDFEARQ